MKRVALFLALASVMAFSGAIRADSEQPAVPTCVELDLVDGSHLIGIPDLSVVPVQTPYAKMKIPLAQIQTIIMGDDHETAHITLRNGDRITGAMPLSPVKLATVFGKVVIGTQHIRKIDVLIVDGNNNPKALLLWNPLGSESDVRNSRVGLGGKMTGGRFVQGRYGRGVELSMNEQLGVSFPAEIVPTEEGCIEFWSKLVDFPSVIPSGPNPALIQLGPENQMSNWAFELSLNPNDGNANAGVTVNSHLGWVGSGPSGGWTYARALKTDNPFDWHHYALVWKGGGNMPGVEDPARRIVVYVDGKLNTATGINNTAATAFKPFSPTDRLSLLGRATGSVQGGRVVYDNLKIWNYAKTDFSDRNEE